MAANNPTHGESIIKIVESTIGGKKLIATDQFQAFLDELGTLFNSVSDDESQDLFTLSVQLGASKARITGNSRDIQDLFNLSASLNVENSRLRAKLDSQIDKFNDLEQVVYGS